MVLKLRNGRIIVEERKREGKHTKNLTCNMQKKTHTYILTNAKFSCANYNRFK